MYRLLFLLLSLLATVAAQAKHEELLNKTFAQRTLLLKGEYEHRLRYRDSAAIFEELAAIRKIADKHNDDDLLMEVKLMEAHYYFYRMHLYQGKQIRSMLTNLSRLGEEQERTWLVARAENMLGLYEYLQGEYEAAGEHFQKMYHTLKDLPATEFPHKQWSIYQFADFYYNFAEYRLALLYLREALNTKEMSADNNICTLIMNSMGLAYRELGQYDSSDYYFQQALQIAIQWENAEWQAITSGNLGHNYVLRGQYDSAIPYLEKDLDMAEKREDWGLASGALMNMASISLARNDRGASDELLQKARVYAYRSGQYKRLKTLYPLLSKFYALSGQPALSARFLDSSLFVRDSLNRAFNALQLLRAQQKAEREQERTQLTQLINEKKIKVLQRNTLVGILILLVALSIYIYMRQRKNNALSNAQLQKAHTDLELSATQLKEFTNYIYEKNEVIEKLQNKLGDDDIIAAQELQKVTILTDAEWEYFQRLFEKVHVGYLIRLKEKLPGLTPAETRLVALSKLKLSTKEMAAALGVGTGAIRQYRSRLRKKLNISEEDNLDAIIEAI